MADDHLHADLHDGKHARVRLQKHNDGEKVDGSWMDRERHDIQTYEYLCHIGEAKEWIEACIKEDIAATTELEEEMRNGIVVAKLAKSFHPESVKRIFENRTKLQYKHSDNINFLFNAMKAVGLPDVFFFETTDLYEKKNFPKVVYCLHALSHVLAKKGLAPSINNLVGKLTFTEDQIEATQQSLEASGVSMPQFGNIENALATAIEEKAEDQESPEDRARREREENEKARQDHFQRNIGKLIQLQSLVRTNQARKLLTELKEADRIKKITKVQAVARARHARKRLESLQEKKAKLDKENRWHELSSKEKLFVKLQARVRGKKERLKYKARLEHYQNNAEAVVKIQALWRAKQMRKAYKNLTSLQNPSTKIIHEFAHLLDESDRDFEDDLDIEDLRQHVVRMIRENVATEAELNELDLKIALLVKNRIGIEDVYHQTLSEGSGSTSTTAYYKKMKNANAGPDQAQRASVVAESEKCAAPFIQKVLDKEARAKLEAYQQLFYLLQTNPNYLAKLMYSLSKRTAGNILKVLEQVTLTLFGYAQNVREEYLLLNLIKTCIKLEVGEIEKLDEFWRANPLFIKLVLQYVRGAKERQFFRDLFQPLIKVVLLDASLNLETDPVFIYKNLIREDELQTGEQSKRSHEASIEQISEDPDVKRNLQDNTTRLQQITDMFLKAIMDSLKSMPFGIRYIAMQLKETMKAKFPGNDTEILKIVGNLIYYRYMNPAIVAPEGFDIIECSVSPIQRRNLAEVAKTLHQISVCRLAGTENNAALASYIMEANKKFMNFFNEASEVVSSEEHFGMDEYIDLSRNQKLSIFITPNEIFQVHDALNSCVEDIIADKNDPMKQVLNELGPAPSPSENTRQEVYLNLVNKFPALEDQDQKTRHLINETKRLVLVVLKVQTGTTLLDILESPVTDKEERFFQDNTEGDYKKLEERREKKEAQEWRNVVDTSPGPLLSSDQNSTENADSVTSDNTKLTQGSLWKQTVDIGGSRNKVSRKKTAECVRLENESHDGNENQLGSGSLFFGSGSLFCLKADPSVAITFNSVKKRALENMAKLEETGTVNKKNGYQDMLNMIAHDMLNRHKRKNQRKHEGQALKKTLSSLEDKAIYLSEQKKSYHDYINSCMAQHKKTLKVKKGPFPFTRQYFHLKELQKSGNVPQFGSYKFTALDLYKRGVLISMNDHSPKQYGQITLTISSSESGIFTIEASILGVKLSDAMELRLEDLLQSQYDGIQTMVLFDVAKVNVNLLTYLLNKKFYV